MEGVGYNESQGLDELHLLVRDLDNVTVSALDPSMDETLAFHCRHDYLPSVADYHQGLDGAGLWFITAASFLAVLIVIWLFVDTVKYVLTSTPAHMRTNTITLLAIYPVVGAASLCGVIVPRAQLIMETVVHEMFMVCLYHMFCLTVGSCGGETGFLAEITPTSLDPRVGPCCCWPCCMCLPTFSPDKRKLRFLRGLVIQATVIQGIIYMIFLVLWSESQELFGTVYNYMVTAVVISVLSGIWALVMTLQMTFRMDHLRHLLLKEKYIVFQLVLILAKFQLVAARLVAANTSIFPCTRTISPSLYTNLIYYVAVIWEMVVLSFLARNFYKKPINGKKKSTSNLPDPIPSIQDKIPPSEIINNNSSIVVRF